MIDLEYIDLIKTTGAYKILTGDFASQKALHAYLIECGDEKLLEEFLCICTAAAVCLQHSPPCLKCLQCDRALSGNYMDITHLPQDSKKIVVADIDAINSANQIKAIDGTKKVFVLHNFDQANTAAQNKLLKVLEEPYPDTHIFLGVKNIQAVLSTVVSRSRVLRIDDFSVSVIESFLNKKYSGKTGIRQAALAGGGKVSRAEALIDDESYKQLLNNVISMLAKMKKSADIIQYSTMITKNKDNIELFLTVLESIVRDLIVAKYAPQLVLYKDRKDDIIAISQEFTSAALAGVTELLVDFKKKLSLNANLQSLADSLLFGILEVKHKCREL